MIMDIKYKNMYQGKDYIAIITIPIRFIKPIKRLIKQGYYHSYGT